MDEKHIKYACPFLENYNYREAHTLSKNGNAIVMPANWKLTAIAWKAGQMGMNYGELSVKIKLGEHRTEDIYEEFKAHYIAEREAENERIAAAKKEKKEKKESGEDQPVSPWHSFFQPPDRIVKSTLPEYMRAAISEEEKIHEAAVF